MQKGKRILAIIGIVVLVGLYVTTFIASIFNTEFSSQLFLASLYSTFIVPLMIYAYTLMYRVIKKKDANETDDVNK